MNDAVHNEGLARDAVGFPSALMQSVAQIAPAFGILATLNFNTQLAGKAAPATYLVAFIIALAVATTVSQLARVLPSAGGFFTYVAATVGPRAGFLVGWAYSGFVAIIPGTIALYSASIVCAELNREFGIPVPWQLVGISLIAIATSLAYLGIRISGSALIILSLIEMLILMSLAASGLIAPGPGGFTAAGFNPLNAPNSSGFYLAVVLSIFAFTGWEGAAAIAEETRDPRRQIPRAIFWSVTILGAFFVFCAWGLQVGWGLGALASLGDSTDNPALIVANRIWGRGAVVVLLAFLNSAIAVCIACAIDTSRNWFSMARAGALPQSLARIHPTFKTPSRAVLVQAVCASILGLGMAQWLGPDQSFLLMGLTGTLVYVVVYCLGIIGVMRHFRRIESPPGVFRRLFLPCSSMIVLAWVAYSSLVPIPAAPVCYAPIIAAGLFLTGGFALMKLLRSGRNEWKSLAGRVSDIVQHDEVTRR